MAKRISELEAAGSVAGTDEFEINQAGVSRKATRTQIVDGLAPIASPTFTGLMTVAGVKVANGSAVTGALTEAAHGGGIFVTSGNVTVPNAAGFSVTLIAGGTHTVGAGGAAHTLASGDVISVFIPAVGTVRASKVAAASVITLPTS